MPAPRRALGLTLLGLYALALLTIGLTRDWRFLHDDNGALQTTLALSHLTLGPRETRAHDVFFSPDTGRRLVYGHHPPGTALLVAGAFALAGADDPWVARLVPIAFHLGTLWLTVELLGAVVTPGAALAGGFVFATVPMSAYFGRMVNYEAPCLFAVMLQLTGYAAWRCRRARGGLARCAVGIALGGLVDWPAFFFAAAIVAAEAWEGWRAPVRRLGPAGALAAVTALTAAFDVWHMWYAGRGSIALLSSVAGGGVWRAELVRLSPTRFVGHLLESARRYFTDAGLLCGLLAVAAAVAPASRIGRWLLDAPGRDLLRALLLVAGCPALAYVLAAPPWATAHPYWQFYALPFVTLATTLVLHHLWRWAATARAIVPALCLAVLVADIAVASAVVLHVRHTRPHAYAERVTRAFRASYLAPRHAAPEGASRDPGRAGRP